MNTKSGFHCGRCAAIVSALITVFPTWRDACGVCFLVPVKAVVQKPAFINYVL